MTEHTKTVRPIKFRRMARKVRPRIQRAFFRWLAENRQRFFVPIQITKRTDRRIEISFVGLNPVVSVLLTNEIGVSVIWGNEFWDYLSCFEVNPLHVENGYICTFCVSEIHEIFPDREALWCDHLFEPFLEWVNSTLVPASHIGLYGTLNSCTYAELKKADALNESQPQPVVLLPLWKH